MTTCIPKGVFIFTEVLDVDFRTVSAGRFDNWHIWEYLLNGVWVRASRGNFPSLTNNIYIEHDIELKQGNKCKDFWIRVLDSITTVGAFDGNDYELEVYGEMVKYTGDYPGVRDASDLGVVNFLGTDSIYVFKENGANRLIGQRSGLGDGTSLQSPNTGCNIIIDFGDFQALTSSTFVLGKNLTIKSGTLKISANSRWTLTSDGDTVRINSGAKYLANRSVGSRNGSGGSDDKVLRFIIDLDGVLEFDAFSSQSGIDGFSITLTGTVTYSHASSTNILDTNVTGTVTATSVGTLILKGAGTKTLIRQETINDLFQVEDDISIAGFTLVYAVGADLKYKNPTIQRLTTNIVLPSVNPPPTDVTIEGGDVKLHTNRTILGDVIVNSGELDLSIADFNGLTA